MSTGEIVAEAGTTISEELATQIQNLAIHTSGQAESVT